MSTDLGTSVIIPAISAGAVDIAVSPSLSTATRNIVVLK